MDSAISGETTPWGASIPVFLSCHCRHLREKKEKKKRIDVVEDISCADNGVYLIVVACVPMITLSFVLKQTWCSGAARSAFLSPDSSEEARTAAGLGTPQFPPPLPLLPLLTIEAKSGVLLPGLDHVLLGAGNNEAFPTALDDVDVVTNTAGNASLLPTLKRTWSRPGSKTLDFASIVSNGSSGSGGGKGEVSRPAAIRASTLLSGERKTGLSATLLRLPVPRVGNTFEPRRVRWLRLVRALLVREPPRQSARENRPGRRIGPRRQTSPQHKKKATWWKT